ncbi:hypothetical protein C8Q77DRAFT_1101002 [Trametes polyzona]|nr:hypothetical protein C8Q77DRAFT_1101002 [Trametes polyzona]
MNLRRLVARAELFTKLYRLAGCVLGSELHLTRCGGGRWARGHLCIAVSDANPGVQRLRGCLDQACARVGAFWR